MTTVCRDTGREASKGSCVVHGGDACLIVLPAYADQRDRYREALIRIQSESACFPRPAEIGVLIARALDDEQRTSPPTAPPPPSPADHS